VKITKRQNDIILGSIFGDGYLDPKGDIARLHLKQSVEKKDYVFWLYHELENLCKSAPKQRKDNQQWYVSTRYFPELMEWRRRFYPKGTKLIPKDIGTQFQSPISLAVWFMDDGTLDWRPKDHYAFRLTTNCFSITDTSRLVEVLSKNFGVEATTQTTLMRGKRYPRIHIGARGRDKFLKLVSPYILKCFEHKLPPLYLTPQRLDRIAIG